MTDVLALTAIYSQALSSEQNTLCTFPWHRVAPLSIHFGSGAFLVATCFGRRQVSAVRARRQLFLLSALGALPLQLRSLICIGQFLSRIRQIPALPQPLLLVLGREQELRLLQIVQGSSSERSTSPPLSSSPSGLPRQRLHQASILGARRQEAQRIQQVLLLSQVPGA